MTVATAEGALRMPVLAASGRALADEGVLAGLRIALLVNVTHESVELARALAAAGARLLVVPSKLTTLDPEAVARLEAMGVECAGRPLLDPAEPALPAVLAFAPDLAVDNGDMVEAWHGPRTAGAAAPAAVTVHSQNAYVRARTVDPAAARFPILSVATSRLKQSVETWHGTGQAAVAGLLRGTGMQLAGKRVLLVGYGASGQGIAAHLHALHARVAVADTDPARALEAHLRGLAVTTLEEGLPDAEVVVTATGQHRLIGPSHFEALADGVVLATIGHHRDEIDLDALGDAADAIDEVNPWCVRYRLGARRVDVLRGDHGNHVFAGINPPEMMDLSLSLHVHALAAAARGTVSLPPGLCEVPAEAEAAVAALALAAAGRPGRAW